LVSEIFDLKNSDTQTYIHTDRNPHRLTIRVA